MKSQNQLEGYTFQITGRHFHVSDPIKDHVVEKISKLERFTHHIIDVAVTMEVHKHEHITTILMHANHIKIKAHAHTTDMYASIDVAVTKLEQQLRKYKTRLMRHQSKPHRVSSMNVHVLGKEEDELDEFNEAIEHEMKSREEKSHALHNIVSIEKMPLKILTSKEAVMKMELSRDQFMVFRHEMDMKLKVIYRRDDENYGVIEVE